MNIKEEPEKEIRILFFHVLKDRKLNKLFFEKHLDQIIVYCILAVARTLNIEIDFSSLIKQ